MYYVLLIKHIRINIHLIKILCYIMSWVVSDRRFSLLAINAEWSCINY